MPKVTKNNGRNLTAGRGSRRTGPRTDLKARRERSRTLGTRIREYRKARSWSLAELSKRCGVATSTLSKIENNNLSLTYDRLCAVAEAFELTPSQFIADPGETAQREGPTARFALARRGQGEHSDTDSYLYTYLCTSLKSKHMVPILSKLKARSMREFGPLSHHEGEEFTVVMKGKVVIQTEFYAPETLEVGEGVYLDSRMGHAYLNAGDGEALILTVNYST